LENTLVGLIWWTILQLNYEIEPIPMG
jgi:hypothetical protein